MENSLNNIVQKNFAKGEEVKEAIEEIELISDIYKRIETRAKLINNTAENNNIEWKVCSDSVNTYDHRWAHPRKTGTRTRYFSEKAQIIDSAVRAQRNDIKKIWNQGDGEAAINACLKIELTPVCYHLLNYLHNGNEEQFKKLVNEIKDRTSDERDKKVLNISGSTFKIEECINGKKWYAGCDEIGMQWSRYRNILKKWERPPNDELLNPSRYLSDEDVLHRILFK